MAFNPGLPTSVLMSFCNPFQGCWVELDHPLALADVQEALDCGDMVLEPPFKVDLTRASEQQADLRRRHAQKIAWFVFNGFQEPLELDVGVPSLGCHVSWIVIDGNHRLAAAIFRRQVYGEDPLLPVSVGGSLDYADELGLLAST